MPFFQGDSMTVRLEHTIATASYDGVDPGSASSWGDYNTDLEPDVAAWFDTNAIFTLGEPTRTDPLQTVDNHERLYFNYAVRKSDGTADINVAYVDAR
jgi:hypothetical protein